MQATVISQDEELHWLALRLVAGLGARNAGKLIARFRTPQAIMRASRSELEAAGMSGAVAQSISSGCSFDDAVEQQQQMLLSETVAVPISDPRYPALLKEIYDPPILLFVRGSGGATERVVAWRRWNAARPTRIRYGGCRSGCRATLRARRTGNCEWNGQWGSTLRRIELRLWQRARRSQCWVAAWISCILRRIGNWQRRSHPRACCFPNFRWVRPPFLRIFRSATGSSAE